MSFKVVEEFENKIADYFGSPYAVSVDCCTHGIELCLRYKNVKKLSIPKRTYLSIPFLSHKTRIYPPSSVTTNPVAPLTTA